MARARKNEAAERALEELYAAEPDEFVATRKRLAKELGGDAGKELAAWRKPTAAAWAVNRLVRERPEDVRELVQAGARLRKLQAQLVAGRQPQGVDEAVRDVRERIPKLTRAALDAAAAAGHPASEATSQRIADTLLAAVSDEELSAELELGRLTRERQPAGFGFVAGSAPARGKTTPRRDDARREAARERVEKAREAVAAAREEVKAKEAESRKREREAQGAAREAETARARLDRAEQALKREREKA